MKRSKTMWITVVSLFALIFAPPVFASTGYLDFGVQSFTGAISYTSYLDAQNIGVNFVIGLNTPAHNFESISFSDAVLTFQSSGAAIYTNGVWDFGSGGTIQVTGTWDSRVGTQTLLSGTFTDLTVSQHGSTFLATLGGISDVKLAALVNYYYPSLTSYDFSGMLNLSFAAGVNPSNHTFTSVQVLSGDIANSPVPIPGAFWLFGSGLAGLIVLRRRCG